ncbi:MAG: GtrA family protein [Clostridia bacterium]|nr:GtrA family protein [Clostridia bacterium]
MWNKLKSLIIKLYNDKRIRFLFVGCLNTLVGTGTTLICYLAMGYGIFEQANVTDLQNFIATVIGYAVGTVHSYIWNKFFTFKSKEKSVWEFFRFVLVCLVQYGVNFGLTLIAKQFISMHFIYTILVTLVCMVVSFIGHSLFSFGKGYVKKENKTQE